MTQVTVSVAEARNNFSKIGAAVVETGVPVTVFRNSKPWLVISPATEQNRPEDAAYEREVSRVAARGEKEYAAGAFMEWDEFLSKHGRR